MGVRMDLDVIALESAITVLGQRLAHLKQHYEVVAIGGASLVLLGYIERTTRDLDLIALMEGGCLKSAEKLPHPLLKEIESVGLALEIGMNWVNAGPALLLQSGLPEGFVDRLIVRKYEGLTIHFASRFDQICFKLYASVDQGPDSKHFNDLKRLNPNYEELLTAKKWCLTQDVSHEFSITLDEAINALRIENGESF